MKEVLEGLKIFYKYNKNSYLHAEHDIIYVCGITPNKIIESDIVKLEELGFHQDDEECFYYFT